MSPKRETPEEAVERVRELLATGEPDKLLAEWEPQLEAEMRALEDAERVTREVLDIFIDI